MGTPIQTIDKYISGFSSETQVLLQQMRKTIQQAAPEAGESIKYAMPTFIQQGMLIHFTAHKSHIGFYPWPAAMITFAEELKPYKTSKGTVQFPFDQPLSVELVKRMAEYRVKEHLEMIEFKKTKRVK